MQRDNLERWFTQQWTKNTPWQCLLRPVSWAFTGIAALRLRLYSAGILGSEKLSVPVIVVGSIAVGGSGKTPTLIALIVALQQQGFTPGVISRGYRAVADGVADEPALIHARTGVPVVCNAQRVEAGKRLLALHPQVNIIVSDDGLQHYGLQRDIELVVLDGTRGPGTAAVLPAGPFREPISRIFAAPAHVARAVVWHGVPNADWQACLDARLRAELATRGFNMRLGAERFVQLVAPEIALSAEDFRLKTAHNAIVACAGIAYPARFFRHLKSQKIALKTATEFADHHTFTAADLAFAGADIILMTQKDAVKCAQFNDPRIWFMQVDALLDDAFWTWFQGSVAAVLTAKK